MRRVRTPTNNSTFDTNGNSVGAGGHFTHGGYGHSSRKWGLALDSIIALDVVLANGTYVEGCNATNEPDLYWVNATTPFLVKITAER
jgi:FAD/FMN-containing dehydrogenase